MPDIFEKFLAKNKRLLYILLFAFFLIMPGISQVDLLSDNGHYFIRAVGYVDHVFSQTQTTPIDWYPQFPKWAFLSFHDHPFLLFFVQHIFISLHESLFFAKLPYILFSLGAICVLYWWMREEYGEKLAEISAVLLAINPLFIWTVRNGFMEAGVVFFVVLSLYYFYKFSRNDKYWLLFGISLGLAFLSKYNSFFLIPTFAFYLLIFNRDILKNKKLYYAIGTALTVFSPAIIYNAILLKTRGHFDYQFSRLFHIKSPWPVSNAGDVLTNPLRIFINLGETMTFVYIFCVVVGLVLAIKNRKFYLPIFSALFLTLLFVITGVGNQYLNLFTILLAPLVAYFLIIIKQKSVLAYKITFCALSTYLIFVTVNSNILFNPVMGKTGVIISSAQSKNYGFYQLDKYMEKMMKDYKIDNQVDGYTHIKSKYPDWLKKYGVSSEIKNRNLENVNTLIVYDQDINWFARLWSLTRRQFYTNLPILSVAELLSGTANIKDVYMLIYIQATENTLHDSVKDYNEVGQYFKKQMVDQGAVEIEPVYRSDGKKAFQIFVLDNRAKK